MKAGFQSRESEYYQNIVELLRVPKTAKKLSQAIVNAPFHDPLMATYLGLGIVVLLKVSDDGKIIKRIALSETEHADNAVKTSEKNFKEIDIPLSYEKNILARAIKTGSSQHTEDWKDLFMPALTAASARFNQASAGIVCSVAQPLKVLPRGGAIIFSFFRHPHDTDTQHFINYYVDLVNAAWLADE